MKSLHPGVPPPPSEEARPVKYMVDGVLCSGHARRQTVAPGVFDLDESMVLPTVPEILPAACQDPASALTLF